MSCHEVSRSKEVAEKINVLVIHYAHGKLPGIVYRGADEFTLRLFQPVSELSWRSGFETSVHFAISQKCDSYFSAPLPGSVSVLPLDEKIPTHLRVVTSFVNLLLQNTSFG